MMAPLTVPTGFDLLRRFVEAASNTTRNLSTMALLLKTALAAAFLASALAAEISTDDGHVNVRVSRAKEFRATRDMEQTASLFKVMEDVATIKDQMKGASNAIEFNKLLSPYVGTSINRIDGLTKDVRTRPSHRRVRARSPPGPPVLLCLAAAAAEGSVAQTPRPPNTNKNLPRLHAPRPRPSLRKL